MTGWGTLDAWVGRTIGVEGLPAREDLDTFQLRCLNETIGRARRESPFYRSRTDWPEPAMIAALTDLDRFPLTTTADLSRGDPSFVALPLRDAARLVTIPTSGTSGQQKRLFFTEADIEAIISYFEHGMATIVRPGSCVAVAFPAARPDSVGDLLMRGLARLGSMPVALPVDGPLDALIAALRELQPSAIAGMPVTLGAAARRMATDGGAPLCIETALVSADSVSPSFRTALAVIWGTEVFDHWGMTETGYGGALACDAHDGLHIRETDLYVEIVDVDTGRVLPVGQEGEIVVTTLRRRGLPLIRYRTGDSGSLAESSCRCGSRLRRLRLGRRIGEPVPWGGGGALTSEIIDDAIFSVDGVIDFSVEVTSGRHPRLAIGVLGASPGTVGDVRATLAGHPLIGPILRSSETDFVVKSISESQLTPCRKRRMVHVGEGD